MSEKLKSFLRNKIEELSGEIKCLKRKNLACQIIHGGLLVISIMSATVVTIIAPLGAIAVVIACVSSLSAISTAFSMKFQLKKKHERLSRVIRQLNVLKDKLDYVVHCNGNLTEEQCNNMLQEFREGF